MSNVSLEQKLYHIGIQLAVIEHTKRKILIDIESTIHEACLEVSRDSRLFSLLCSWVSVHGNYVITEKLMKIQKKQYAPWLTALAIFATNIGFHKWKRLLKKHKEQYALVSLTLALSSIELKGEEPNFKKYGFLLPKNIIRIRSSDVLKQPFLIKKNKQYFNRLRFGSSWRADIITAIEFGIENPYQIAKVLGCSYEPAHRIFNEYQLLHQK